MCVHHWLLEMPDAHEMVPAECCKCHTHTLMQGWPIFRKPTREEEIALRRLAKEDARCFLEHEEAVHAAR